MNWKFIAAAVSIVVVDIIIFGAIALVVIHFVQKFW